MFILRQPTKYLPTILVEASVSFRILYSCFHLCYVCCDYLPLREHPSIRRHYYMLPPFFSSLLHYSSPPIHHHSRFACKCKIVVAGSALLRVSLQTNFISYMPTLIKLSNSLQITCKKKSSQILMRHIHILG